MEVEERDTLERELFQITQISFKLFVIYFYTWYVLNKLMFFKKIAAAFELLKCINNSCPISSGVSTEGTNVALRNRDFGEPQPIT